MGRGIRLQPRRSSKKLKRIRDRLECTQREMADRLKHKVPRASIHPGHVSQFENGTREPSLLVLLAYARLAGTSTDILIDDRQDLP